MVLEAIFYRTWYYTYMRLDGDKTNKGTARV